MPQPLDDAQIYNENLIAYIYIYIHIHIYVYMYIYIAKRIAELQNHVEWEGRCLGEGRGERKGWGGFLSLRAAGQVYFYGIPWMCVCICECV
jgi:hypothetical protein